MVRSQTGSLGLYRVWYQRGITDWNGEQLLSPEFLLNFPYGQRLIIASSSITPVRLAYVPKA